MSFVFVSGDPSLDFAATVGSRAHNPVDALAGPADLERWIRECDGLPDPPVVDPSHFDAAVRLREAIYRLARDRIQDRAFDPADLEIVNEAADAPPIALRLDRDGRRISGDIRAVLSQLARNAIVVLTDPGAHLKECGRTDCSRVYLDRSRGARRSWCGMEECGNRVKAAAYRARKRAVSGAPPPNHDHDTDA